MRPLQRLIRNSWTQSPMWSWDTLSASFTGMVGEKETIGADYTGYVHDALRRSGVVYACIATRLFVFSEARFRWQEEVEGRPGNLFWDDNLETVETPWTNGTTGHLLAWMELGESLAGNYYGLLRNGRIRNLRPDWMTIVTASPDGNPYHPEAQVAGYSYKPPNSDAELFTPDEIIHYAPFPDPAAQWRGMSWMTPAINEIRGDLAATRHKLKFFENGAVPGFAIKYDPSIGRESFEAFVAKFKEQHEGVDNAYKALHLGGGADPVPLGANLQQLDFKVTQGSGETRIAAASGAHPVVVALSEGMQGSSLNAGNFQAARRIFVDKTIRPRWRFAAAALQSILNKPARPNARVRLWYDDRDIAFLRQDAKEEADIRQTTAGTIRQLIEAGYDPASVVEAVTSGDMTRLTHSGLYSVQLQQAGTQPNPGASDD